MTRRLAIVVLGIALAAPAAAWEPDSTHVGLTEQAALASRLHARLQAIFGRRGGWLEPLRLAPERAGALYQKLAMVAPTSGVVPDRAGRQSALSWLLAGAVVEGVPSARERNHFYDPIAKRGLVQDDVKGVPAPDWILAKDNDLGLERFQLEVERAVIAPGPTERDEHLAMALLCAGAMLHVLEDVGEPARVRGDRDEFLLPLGGGANDRGSRFERLAALLFGRLGVPAAGPVVARAHARDFFTAADGKGLADRMNASYYSSGTLPGTVTLPPRTPPAAALAAVARASRYPSPKPTRELVLGGPEPGPDGQILRNDAGVCLANYSFSGDELRLAISDDCAASQLRAIFPEIGGYAAGFLEFLFRGTLAVAIEGAAAKVSVPHNEAQLGAGKVTVAVEDQSGKRSIAGVADLEDGAARVAIPADATHVYAVFRGVDAAGEPVVAVGSTAR